MRHLFSCLEKFVGFDLAREDERCRVRIPEGVRLHRFAQQRPRNFALKRAGLLGIVGDDGARDGEAEFPGQTKLRKFALGAQIGHADC